jgi:superfamily I DNA and/or RNA helicase
LDLADPRHRDRLPSELRPGLPSQGLVNYLEAVAIVKAVEALVRDPALRAELGPREPGASPPSLAVIALYAAQAELIRCLLAQAPCLAGSGLAVEVGVPSAFRHRECQVALVSLTRSHTHRAVAFGEAPELFALALTRARRQLILFGDPGTLARRSQWQGPLDHLGEIAAGRERAVVGRLVDYLHGPGPQPPSFHLRTSSGP